MGGEPWRLVPAGVTLREQVNARWPNRDKASDGTIGDAAHQGRPSDHNPDADGWVHAIDIDEDLGEPGAMRALADELVALARRGEDGGRLKNLVYEGQVASGTYASTYWQWRGSGYGHEHHLHISFTDAAERDGSPFPLDILGADMPLSDDDINRIADAVWRKAFREYIDEDGDGVREPRKTVDVLFSIHRDVSRLADKAEVTQPADAAQVAEAVADELADRLRD